MMAILEKAEQIEYLLSRGWHWEKGISSPWHWRDPECKTSFYCLRDALEKQRKRDLLNIWGCA